MRKMRNSQRSLSICIRSSRPCIRNLSSSSRPNSICSSTSSVLTARTLEEAVYDMRGGREGSWISQQGAHTRSTRQPCVLNLGAGLQR